MALPHYKLHTLDESVRLQPDSFPVILVPADPPRRAERLRTLLRSKKLLTTLAIFAVISSAALLWLLLEPSGKTPNLRYLMILGGVVGFCLLYFLVAAALGGSAEAEAPPPVEPEFVPIKMREQVRAAPKPPRVEVYCEEWSSKPFSEIMDEAVMAEVLDDDMIAPDRMIFSLRVKE